MAQGLFNLGIQVINSIAKTEKIAIETTMDLFSLAMKTANEEAEKNQEPAAE